MKISKSVPTLSVYAPNRTTWLGATRQPLELNFEYNFNGCSTLEFEINKYVYDENRFKWVLNPLYDAIQKRNLIYVAGNDEVFSYQTNELYSPSAYTMMSETDQYAINALAAGLSYRTYFNNCTLQDETLLFDVGARDGYQWSLHTKMEQNYSGEYLFAPGSGYSIESTNRDGSLSKLITAEQFLPVQEGDIIALGSRHVSGNHAVFVRNATAFFSYLPFFYSDTQESACTHIGTDTTPTSEEEEEISKVVYDPITRIRVGRELLGSASQSHGFVRFMAEFMPESGSQQGYLMPNYGYVKIFSGERRLKSLDVSTDKVNIQHGIPWWVITEVSDSKQGMNSKKTVRAYSYEYVLSYRNTSLSESVLPLYVPDVVVDTVRSDDFLYYRMAIIEGANVRYENASGAQRMERGLMNQVLDCLPDWSIQYISKGLAEKYRSVPEVDNENIYSFLMNTIQGLYNCYFVFDTENKRINILSHEDVLSSMSGGDIPYNIILSQRNLLREVNVGETDDSFLTSCRVYSNDATYGIGLVNPNATDNVVNFQSALPLLDYVADENHLNSNTGDPFTLRELCEIYANEYNTEWANIKRDLGSASTASQPPVRWTLITSISELPQLQARLSNVLAQFRVAVTENDIKLNDEDVAVKVPPNPLPVNAYVTGDFSYEGYGGVKRDCWADRESYRAVLDSARNYWIYKNHLDEVQEQISNCLASIRSSALRYCLDVRVLQPLFNANHDANNAPTANYTPIFTPIEAAEMAKYIYEGTWTNDNIIFSEEYSPTDIVNTLVDFMDTAKTEMDTLYSKPQYEFEVDLADLRKNSLLARACESLYLGHALTIDDGEGRSYPTLLQLKLSYGADGNTEMGFSTNYKRKPLETRFSDMFATINQVSVTSPQYTYEG